MVNVGAVYAPVEFAFNSEVTQAAQIIPHPGVFLGGMQEHHQSWFGNVFSIESRKRRTILIAHARVADSCAALLELGLTQLND